MCNRYRMTEGQAALAKKYGIDPPYPPDITIPPPELFPKRPAYVVREEDEKRVLNVMTWGFPPPVAHGAPVTNVRNLKSPFWRTALSRPDRRCLVPATTFCEWEGAIKGQKVPRWFAVPSRPIFTFAGVWRPTEDGDKFAFLTTDPNPLVEAIHPKAMPMILHPEYFGEWLNGSYSEIVELVGPYPSQLMAMT